MKNTISTLFRNASGIYCISNTLDKRIYIGSAVKLFDRYRSHKSLLDKGKHNSIILQRFCDKYGSDVLYFSLLEICTEDDLLSREQYYLDALKPKFNIRKVADRNSGIIRRPETIEKLKQAGKKRMQTPEGMAHMRRLIEMPKLGNTGNTHSAETKAKISANKNTETISGSNHYLSRISPEQAAEIRAYVPEKLGDMKALAIKYGVATSTIKRIRSGKRYKL